MNNPITFWPSKVVKVKDLKDYEHNPRRITKIEFDKLVADIKRQGFHNRIKVNQDNVIIGGHSRKKALLAAGLSPEDEIEVLYPPHPLTDKEFQELNVKDNLTNGDWDYDTLANNFDTADLIEWGMDLPLDSKEVEKPVKDEDPTKDVCSECGRNL